MRRLLILATTIIMTMPAWGVGTVTQSLNTLGAQNWVLAINWTGDSVTGTVPATLTTSAQIIQGYRVFAIEVSPGSPAPTNLYSITLTTFLGVDVLSGGGGSLSNTTAAALQVPATAPPVNGALTFNLSGNSVAGAKGNVLVYFAPIAQVTGLLAPTGPSLTGNNLFSGNNTFSGTNTLSGTTTISGPATFTGSTSVLSLNNVQYCDQFAGATADAKINACIGALPAAGGVADARGIIGAQSFASTLVISKTVTLLLGAVKITGPASGDMIDVSTQGVIIRGIGSMQNSGATQGTVLIPVTAAQAHGINFQAAAVQYVVADLTINDSTAGGTTRTAGDGIRASANASPAQNSIGKIDNVYISFMFNGVNLIRPITTTVSHATLTSNKNDGFRAQGDGTSTWCTQCYSNHSGRHNYSFWGMNYSGTLEGASDNANGDGYRVDNCQNDGATCPGGNTQSLAMTISGGAELDCINGGASCAGVHLLDAIGVELLGQKVINSHGYGIWVNGARGVAAHGFVTGSTSNDIQVDCSGTPQCASGYLLNNLIYTTSGGAQINSAGTIIGWTGGGGGANALFATSSPVQLFEAAAPPGVAASDVCYGDSTAHGVKCSYNNGTFFNLPLVGTANTWSANQSFNSGTLLPSAAAGTDLGSASLPFGNLWLGTAATNNFKFAPAATAAARTITVPDPLANDTLAFLAATQTFTNKTIASPIITGTVPTYNGSNTAGQGLVPISCVTSQKTESAADANLLTCAIPASAGSYRLRFILSLSAASNATMGWTATWTDSNGNAQTPTNLWSSQPNATPSLTSGPFNAAGNMYGSADIDVNNAGTSIVIKLTFSGTSFTAKATATVERIV